jgi:hypothetical protein
MPPDFCLSCQLAVYDVRFLNPDRRGSTEKHEVRVARTSFDCSG